MQISKSFIKLSLIGLCGVMAAVYCFVGRPAEAFSTGPPASRTGAPALGASGMEPTCTACHTTFPLNSGPGALAISGLPVFYMPGQEITVTVTVTQPNRARYGFEATVLDDQGRRAGDLVVTDANRTRIIDGAGNFAGRQYIQHTLAGTQPGGMNQGSWSFTWRAPAQSVGRVTFYVAGNAADGQQGNANDFIYNASQSVQPAGGVALVSAASFAPSGSLTAESIAAIFGMGLADGTAVAATIPLPTTLAGTTVRVRDAAGMERDAPLFFASMGQINLLIPRETSAGVATLTVARGGNMVSAAAVTIESVAPTLFSANANGQGVAAALALRVRADGSQVIEPIAQFNAAANRFEAIPLDLGPAGEQVFLVGFGTGLRGRGGANQRAILGAANADLAFLGAQGQFEGLDQFNLLLPRSLAGRGDVEVALNVDGKRSNAVTINIK